MDFSLAHSKVEFSHIIDILNFLNNKRVKEIVEFINGKEKRKTPIQRYIEAVEDIIVKQCNMMNSIKLSMRETAFLKHI